MQRQRGERAAMGGDPARGVERAEIGEQRARLGEGRRRRRGQEGEAVGRGGAPERELEREAGEVGAGDLGRREGGERPLLAAGPEAVAPAGRDPAGAAAALLGLGAGHALGDEAGHAGAGVEAGAPRAAGVDDHAHVGDGQRGLGDRGGEHQLAPARASGASARALLGEGQAAVQRLQRHVRPAGAARGARRCGRSRPGRAGRPARRPRSRRARASVSSATAASRRGPPAGATTAGRASGSRPARRGPRR